MNEITIALITNRLWKHRKLVLLLPALVAVVVFAVVKLCPTYYRSQSVFRMEPKSSEVARGLHIVASQLGFDVGKVHTYADGVSPKMYHHLFRSDKFTDELLNIRVTNSEGQQMPLYEHLGGDTPEERRERAHQAIICGINTHKSVIVINVADRDAMVCATLADSVRDHLCNWLLDYRTQKYQERVDYLASEVQRARAEYQVAQKKYERYADSHRDGEEGSLASTRTEELSELAYNKFRSYRATLAQWQNAEFQLHERAPVRLVMRNSAVSVEPAGPKATSRTVIMALLTFACLTVWLIRKELWAQFA